MKRRLFLAIPLDKRYLRACMRLRDAYGRIPYLRWTPLANLHVTVLFIGNVEEELVPPIRSSIEDRLREFEHFELRLDKVTYAPHHRPADMVWAKFHASDEFERLAELMREAVTEVVAPPEQSHPELTPHITLARFKRSVPKRPLYRLPKIGLEGSLFPVESVVLFESRLRGAGAQYRPLMTFDAAAS